MNLDELRQAHQRWNISERKSDGRVVATTDGWATQTAATCDEMHERLADIDPIIARPTGLT